MLGYCGVPDDVEGAGARSGGKQLASMGQGQCGPGGTGVLWCGLGGWWEPAGASGHHRQEGDNQVGVGPPHPGVLGPRTFEDASANNNL